VVKWHGLISAAIPFFTVSYNRGDDFSRFPLHLIELVPDPVCTFVTHGAINQDKKIPVRFRESITTGAGTVKNNLCVWFHVVDSLSYLSEQLLSIHVDTSYALLSVGIGRCLTPALCSHTYITFFVLPTFIVEKNLQCFSDHFA
jgi:hypothetical protein